MYAVNISELKFMKEMEKVVYHIHFRNSDLPRMADFRLEKKYTFMNIKFNFVLITREGSTCPFTDSIRSTFSLQKKNRWDLHI